MTRWPFGLDLLLIQKAFSSQSVLAYWHTNTQDAQTDKQGISVVLDREDEITESQSFQVKASGLLCVSFNAAFTVCHYMETLCAKYTENRKNIIPFRHFKELPY